MQTQKTDTLDKLGAIARDLRNPEIVADPKAFSAARSEHERLKALAHLEAEQAAEIAAERTAREQAEAARVLAAAQAEAIARATIDDELAALGLECATALLAAEEKIAALRERHQMACADVYRLGAMGAFSDGSDIGGRQRAGRPTRFGRIEEVWERVRVHMRDSLMSAGQPPGYPEKFDRGAIHILPKG